jgi:hypothetical protein
MPHFLAWARLDVVYLDAARRQIEIYEQECQRPEFETCSERRRYWGLAYAGACIAMVCAAMEAHVNRLLDWSARDLAHNHLKLSSRAVKLLCRSLSPEAKWLVASITLTGKQVLDPGRPPFQQLCDAFRRRNEYVAHAKPQLHEVADDKALDDLITDELAEVTIPNAKVAIRAAEETMKLVHETMGPPPPRP